MASAVGAQLGNIFGQQNSQNTGQLTQAAGGVGADRIAVGQANLANQQGLAAGQTFAGLYGQAQQAAQQQQQAQMQAAAGLGNVGQGMQNAALQGGQSLLGAGGLQQQLAQAQLNSPYQQQLAALAFPYQQAQFLSGQVGALAPGLGGTTTGQGTTQSQFNPSIWGQIGGGLQTLGGIGGYLGGSGSKGSSPNTAAINQSMNTLNNGTGGDYYGPGFAGGGMVNPFAAGGAVGNPFDSTVSDQPINIAPQSIIPAAHGKAGDQSVSATPHIQAHVPQLNLNPPQQQQSGGGGGGVGLGTLLQIASMFGSGGAVPSNPYGGSIHDKLNHLTHRALDRMAGGGEVSDDTRAAGLDMLRNAMNGGGNEPFRMPDQGAVDDWRNGTPLPAANSVPMPQPRPSAGDEAPDDVTASSKLPPVASPSLAPQGAQADTGPSLAGFLKSPWAALSLGGLEAMRTGSLASGFGQTLKLAQTQREADQKEQEHQDSLTKMTPYQTAQIALKKQEQEGTAGEKSDIIKNISDGIEDGTQPPTTAGLYKYGAGVRSELASRKVNLSDKQLQYQRAQQLGRTLNSERMIRFVSLSDTVDSEIDRVKELAGQLKNSGVPALNALKLQTLIQTEGNSPKGRLATQYLTMINSLKENFAQLANGGYAPTDPAWKLANQQINGNYGLDQIGAALGEVQKTVRYRKNAIVGLGAMGPASANQYTGQPGQAAPPPAAAAGAQGAAPMFTGRTASGPGGAKLRETSTGEWVK